MSEIKTRYESKSYDRNGNLVCRDTGYSNYDQCKANALRYLCSNDPYFSCGEFVIIEVVEFKITSKRTKEISRRLVSLINTRDNQQWNSSSF